ncbi:phage tail assembly protein [Pseudovibrio ascidiaceicola]|uniref:Phage tail assembly chaperone protein, E, or 41 or 14 n=1 Tax=Pseudovibrio ascidiaceicola TaxID=285279 RepID=A0A1I4DZW9_9HYPH|nr:phage tail assembly protein [Pseudovibrio ascidiaceicola]SFK99138.1 Phage tail assembly chaperone protein, E, or 41 or 14 [Pseudovibrio ascidiaceicola]
MTEKATKATVQLDYPFEHDGREVTSLSFRRMRAGDTLIGEKHTNEQKAGFALLAELAGVDLDVIERLDIEDLDKATRGAAPLMGKQGILALKQLDARDEYLEG